MHPLLHWLYSLPNWLVCVLILMLIVGGSLLGQVFTLRWVRRSFNQVLEDHNEAVGAFIQAYGVFYGIFLGLIAVAAWGNYDKCEDIVESEAAAYGALARDISVLPEPIRSTLKAELFAYLEYLIDRGWALNRAGLPTSEGNQWTRKLHRRLSEFVPETKRDEILFQEALEQFNTWIECRNSRKTNLETCLPSVLWGILMAGAVINMLILYAIRIEPFHVHLTLTGLVAAFIGLMIFLIAAMDHPFQGELSIDPGPFQELRATWDQIWTS